MGDNVAFRVGLKKLGSRAGQAERVVSWFLVVSEEARANWGGVEGGHKQGCGAGQ